MLSISSSYILELCGLFLLRDNIITCGLSCDSTIILIFFFFYVWEHVSLSLCTNCTYDIKLERTWNKFLTIYDLRTIEILVERIINFKNKTITFYNFLSINDDQLTIFRSIYLPSYIFKLYTWYDIRKILEQAF